MKYNNFGVNSGDNKGMQVCEYEPCTEEFVPGHGRKYCSASHRVMACNARKAAALERAELLDHALAERRTQRRTRRPVGPARKRGTRSMTRSADWFRFL